MFARKKNNQLTICWPRCSPGTSGDLGVQLYPNRFFFIPAGEIQPYSSGWPCVRPRGRMREWELDPRRGKSTAASLFLACLGSLYLPRFERFCVFWCGLFFVPKQNGQNAVDHFLFWLKKQFPMSSTRNNRALILIGASGCVTIMLIGSALGLCASGTFQALYRASVISCSKNSLLSLS